MSEEGDRLADMARNRGLKLLRSRVRTPGKPGFGCYGLADENGDPVFGVRGKRALRASADEIQDYLRGAETGDWKKSVKAVGGRAKPSKAKPPPPLKKPPAPTIRQATRADLPQLVRLFALLDHRIDPARVAANLLAMKKAGDQLLVAARGKDVLAACALHATVHSHRDAPVGRISILVVAEAVRRTGLGRRLVAEAERLLAARGCTVIEVTSNERLNPAHAFYQHLGYERTSLRFAKTLGSG